MLMHKCPLILLLIFFIYLYMIIISLSFIHHLSIALLFFSLKNYSNVCRKIGRYKRRTMREIMHEYAEITRLFTFCYI